MTVITFCDVAVSLRSIRSSGFSITQPFFYTHTELDILLLMVNKSNLESDGVLELSGQQAKHVVRYSGCGRSPGILL